MIKAYAENGSRGDSKSSGGSNTKGERTTKTSFNNV